MTRGFARLLRLFAALATGVIIVATEANTAHAFCVENETETRLLFTARIKGEADKGLIFSQWVDGRTSACAAPKRGPDILELFVFAHEDSVEGCDDEIAASGTLRLSKFEEFDNCVWGE